LAAPYHKPQPLTPDSEWKYRVYSEFGGNMSLVARTGDHAPGTEEGVLLRSFEAGFNRDGRTVVLATLSGPTVGEANDTGLWIQDDLGQLVLIARTGSLLEVRPGEFRSIETLAYSGGAAYASGHSGAFSDAGDVVFRATFTDGSSGIFLYGAIPEPGTCSLAFAAFVLTAGCCRSKKATRLRQA
jgi:hypothetical protein